MSDPSVCPRGLGLLAGLVGLLLKPTGRGDVSSRLASAAFPLPRPSTLLTRTEGRASYLTLGRERIPGVLQGKADRLGWTSIELFGEAHVLTGGGRRLTLVSIACAPFLTVVNAALGEDTADPERSDPDA